jgi:hypothetical protein
VAQLARLGEPKPKGPAAKAKTGAGGAAVPGGAGRGKPLVGAREVRLGINPIVTSEEQLNMIVNLV